MENKLSQKLYEHVEVLEEASQGTNHPYLTAMGSGAAIGGAVGMGVNMAGKGSGLLHGAVKGFKAGSIAALLMLGGSGIAKLIAKARQNGKAETKQAIRSAVSRAQENNKLTNTQKNLIRTNGQAAIAKIDQAVK